MHQSRSPLFSYVFRKIRTGVAAVLAISFFINLLMLASPLYMLQIYDRILTSRSIDSLLLLTLIVLAALATIGVLEWARSGLMSQLSLWISQSLSGEALRLAIQQQLAQSSGDAVLSLRDLDTVRGFITSPTVYPLVDAPWASIYLLALFLLHPWLGGIALGGALVLLLLAVLNDIGTRKRQEAAGVCARRALGHAEASVRNADVVTAMGMAPQLVEGWNHVHGLALQQQSEVNLSSGASIALAKFLRLSLQVAILGCGGYLAIEGVISAGTIVAGSILVARALAPVDQAIVTWRSALAAYSAYRRLQRHFHLHDRDCERMALPPPRGDVRAEGLVFAFPGQDEAALKGVSFALAAGETLVLAGASGSGKTTLVRVLLGNLAPQQGHARLDGLEIGQWDASSRTRYIGYLSQDVELFAGSVRENIARMTQGDPAAVVRAAKMADVHSMIMRLPEGYNTQIGASGLALSGGQRQRIGLARALYGNPRLVVLDEPHAHLDRSGERALFRALQLLKRQGVTCILITHRPQRFRWVDRVLILHEGRVRALGVPAQVLRKRLPSKSLAEIRPMTAPKLTFRMGERDGH